MPAGPLFMPTAFAHIPQTAGMFAQPLMPGLPSLPGFSPTAPLMHQPSPGDPAMAAQQRWGGATAHSAMQLPPPMGHAGSACLALPGLSGSGSGKCGLLDGLAGSGPVPISPHGITMSSAAPDGMH